MSRDVFRVAGGLGPGWEILSGGNFWILVYLGDKKSNDSKMILKLNNLGTAFMATLWSEILEKFKKKKI